MKALSVKDGLRYENLKRVVSDNLDASYKAWSAMKEIKEDKLYRQEFGTWEEFCDHTYKLSASYVNRMIAASDVAGTVPDAVINESQARALADVPVASRPAVVKRAAASGSVTAQSIKKAAAVIEVEQVYYDALGYPIPDGCVSLWIRRDEIQDLLTSLSHVKSAVAKGWKDEDPLFRIVPQAVVDHLSRTYQFITDAKPYAVCLYCSGADATKKHCSICRGTGLVSKFSYDQKSDKKMLAMREQQLKKMK